MTHRNRLSSIALTAALLLTGGLAGATPGMAAESWSVDPAHTRVSFAVNHFYSSGLVSIGS